MSEFIYARNFRELVVYQRTFDLSRKVFELSKAFPEDEKFSLTSQIRRSSRSVGAQIAEAWAKRKYERHFVSKLTDADGEQMETQHWVRTAFSCGYLERAAASVLMDELEQVGRLLQGMMDKAESFCSNSRIAEAPSAYGDQWEDPLTTDNR
jgi:four helix bundle protein